MLRVMRENGERHSGRNLPSLLEFQRETPTLGELGFSKTRSWRWQLTELQPELQPVTLCNGFFCRRHSSDQCGRIEAGIAIRLGELTRPAKRGQS
jgi:hypothetical protein